MLTDNVPLKKIKIYYIEKSLVKFGKDQMQNEGPIIITRQIIAFLTKSRAMTPLLPVQSGWFSNLSELSLY